MGKMDHFHFFKMSHDDLALRGIAAQVFPYVVGGVPVKTYPNDKKTPADPNENFGTLQVFF